MDFGALPASLDASIVLVKLSDDQRPVYHTDLLENNRQAHRGSKFPSTMRFAGLGLWLSRLKCHVAAKSSASSVSLWQGGFG